jgi:hypothetical protein
MFGRRGINVSVGDTTLGISRAYLSHAAGGVDPDTDRRRAPGT